MIHQYFGKDLYNFGFTRGLIALFIMWDYNPRPCFNGFQKNKNKKQKNKC